MFLSLENVSVVSASPEYAPGRVSFLHRCSRSFPTVVLFLGPRVNETAWVLYKRRSPFPIALCFQAHSYGCWLASSPYRALGWDISSLPCRPFYRISHDRPAGLPQSAWLKEQEEKPSWKTLSLLIWKWQYITFNIFYSFKSITTSSPYPRGRNYTRAQISGGSE